MVDQIEYLGIENWVRLMLMKCDPCRNHPYFFSDVPFFGDRNVIKNRIEGNQLPDLEGKREIEMRPLLYSEDL